LAAGISACLYLSFWGRFTTLKGVNVQLVTIEKSGYPLNILYIIIPNPLYGKYFPEFFSQQTVFLWHRTVFERITDPSKITPQ
jgi:hypothetical protein